MPLKTLGGRGDGLRLSHPLVIFALVLAVGMDLGTDSGTCRALQAMYQHLHRVFKVAGAVGSL